MFAFRKIWRALFPLKRPFASPPFFLVADVIYLNVNSALKVREIKPSSHFSIFFSGKKIIRYRFINKCSKKFLNEVFLCKFKSKKSCKESL